jgi:hypothetical protein
MPVIFPPVILPAVIFPPVIFWADTGMATIAMPNAAIIAAIMKSYFESIGFPRVVYYIIISYNATH